MSYFHPLDQLNRSFDLSESCPESWAGRIFAQTNVRLNGARCNGHSRLFIKIHGVQRRGQLSRVNGTIKMQHALNIQINAKSDPFPNLLFFPQNCGHRKAATDPRTQVQQLPSNKKWFHFYFSPRVCDFQPPCRSHAHLFERDNLHRTVLTQVLNLTQVMDIHYFG